MSCEAMRAAMRASGDGEWPPAVVAHLTTCEACVEAAIDLTLRQRPSATASASFAVDVARRARVAQPVESGRRRVAIFAVVAGIMTLVVPAVWLAASGTERAALPIAALMLALAETIVLAAWTLQTDVVRVR